MDKKPRQPRGVPIGGEFASTQRPGGTVDLQPEITPSARIDAALTRIHEVHAVEGRQLVRGVAGLIREHFPDATWLYLDPVEDGPGCWEIDRVEDAQGNVLGQLVGDFDEPDGLDRLNDRYDLNHCLTYMSADPAWLQRTDRGRRARIDLHAVQYL